MMIHPRKLDEKMIAGIKQYSNRGGKTLLLLDTAAEAQRIFSPVNSEFYPSQLNGLNDFWGFRFYNEVVVADLENSIVVDATKNYSTNPIFTQDVVQFKLGAAEFNPDFAVTKNLQSILFASASVIAPTGKSLFLPLIKAGENSGLLSSGVVYDGKNPSELLDMFAPDKQLKFISALLTAKHSATPFEVIVVADTDFIYDTFWSVGRTILENNYFIPIFDNGNFVLNALDYLSGDMLLTELRGHALRHRSFDGMEQMRKQNLLEFRIKEKAIFDEIDSTRKGLQEIYAKRKFEERQDFNADELALIAGTRQRLDVLRNQLSNIRRQMHQNINRLSLEVKAVNIYAVPLLLLLGLGVFGLRQLLKKRRRTQKLRINREFKLVLLLSMLLLAAGAVSVYWSGRDDLSRYENEPVFADLLKNINQAEKITLTSHNGRLDFYKENGVWKLQGYPCFPVYQERIERLLMELGNAVYYEKKSDKVEYLTKFGLQPLELEGSPNVRIEVSDKDGKAMAELNVGRYDIDIGRGARAAYIRLGNRFQVWMIKADFVDLQLNLSDWTYSALWNLRFGRLRRFNNVENPNRVAELVKYLLNTLLQAGCEVLPNEAPEQSLQLFAEDYAKIKLDFFAKDGNTCVRYGFSDLREASHLSYFAAQSQNCCYKIDKEKFEKINEIITISR